MKIKINKSNNSRYRLNLLNNLKHCSIKNSTRLNKLRKVLIFQKIISYIFIA